MKISLSALAPVYNCQATVGLLASQLLEHLAELSYRFELVIIDNGSTDATAEVISDLAVLYPQLSRVVLAERSSWAEVVRAGLRQSSGEIVLHRSEHCRSGFSSLPGLWQAMRLGDVAVVRPARPSTLGLIPPLPLEDEAVESDWQMVRRCALDGWMRTRSKRDWVSFLTARGYAVQEIDARNRAAHVLPQPKMAVQPGACVAAAQPHAEKTGHRPTRRPNYLDRLRSFAWGE
ncbi:MAG TPA: glycosyltransferase, partial [Pirellulales bacterium]|nr:glycosyltransferase [Pirellulales bacterium]